MTPRPARDDALTAQLLRDVQARVPGAWERLVTRYGRLVLAVPRDLGLSEADCDEVFQATWMALFEQIELIRQPSSLGSWIITTAQRQCWRLRRRIQRQREQAGLEGAENLPDLLPEPSEQAERLEREGLVREALDELRPRCRELLTRLFLTSPGGEAAERDSYAAISRELGMPVGSIGPTRLRCLAELARILGRKLEP